MNEPYIAITPAGLNAMATNREINKILQGVYHIFRNNPDITLPVKILVKYSGGDIVCELVDETTEETVVEDE